MTLMLNKFISISPSSNQVLIGIDLRPEFFPLRNGKIFQIIRLDKACL